MKNIRELLTMRAERIFEHLKRKFYTQYSVAKLRELIPGMNILDDYVIENYILPHLNEDMCCHHFKNRSEYDFFDGNDFYRLSIKECHEGTLYWDGDQFRSLSSENDGERLIIRFYINPQVITDYVPPAKGCQENGIVILDMKENRMSMRLVDAFYCTDPKKRVRRILNTPYVINASERSNDPAVI